MVGAGDRENSLGELTQTRTCRPWLGMRGEGEGCGEDGGGGGGGNASAVQEATHCQRPVPAPGSRSPRRCTLSVCVDRQQSHSVQEKEACVSRPPPSQPRDGHPNGPFTGIPASGPHTSCSFPSTGPRRPDSATRSPTQSGFCPSNTPNTPTSEEAALWSSDYP